MMITAPGKGPCSADDFDVVEVDTGERIGRYDRFGMGRPDWFWVSPSLTRSARWPYFGPAESKDAAKRAFAER